LPDAVRGFRFGGGCPPGQVVKVLISPPANDPSAPRQVCVEERKTTCWGPPQPLSTLDANGIEQGGAGVEENGQRWRYSATERYMPGTRYTDMARVRFWDRLTPMPETIERLALADIGGPSGIGWNQRPILREDALEMVFESSRPNATWQYPKIYLSSRQTLG